jgi:hypothetical protein
MLLSRTTPEVIETGKRVFAVYSNLLSTVE